MAPTLSAVITLLFTSASLVIASDSWTLNCAALTQQRSDPIEAPGIASSHVHAVVGSTAFSRHMSGVDGALNGRATTCDKFTDHSSYWCPQLYHMDNSGKFNLLPFTGMVAYYENYTCAYNPDTPGVCPETRHPRAFPAGLRMMAGNTTRRTFNPSDPWDQAILFETGDNGEVYGIPKQLDGAQLSGHVRFPSCWDGVHLDSEDHQSHVSYPDPKLGGNTQGGMCPKSHPVALINIGAEFGFTLNGITDPTSLVFANGDTTGYGFHGDFWAGWENTTALRNSFADCFTNDDCPWRAFGAPHGMDPNPTRRTPEVPAPDENIGLHGPIDKLPGDNPVYRPSRIMRR